MKLTSTLLFNDTSNYHSGCAKVIEYIKSRYDIIATIPGNRDRVTYDENLFDQAEHIMINGEGTMHSDRRVPLEFLDILVKAQKQGKKTSVINSVFQGMSLSKTHINALQQSYVSVREVMSQRFLKEYNIDSEIHLDCSYWIDVPVQNKPKKRIVIGKNYSNSGIDRGFEDAPTVDIFKDNWNHIVNTLRNADIFITSRHHEMYAACKARCPFIVVEGNTWKNQALFSTAGIDIPYVKSVDNVLNCYTEVMTYWKDYKTEYNNLFNWMEQQPKL